MNTASDKWSEHTVVGFLIDKDNIYIVHAFLSGTMMFLHHENRGKPKVEGIPRSERPGIKGTVSRD